MATTDLEELERLHAELLALPKWYVTTNEGGIESLTKLAAIAKALPGLLAELRALREVAGAALAAVDMVDEENERDDLRRALAKVPK